jgi:hypothetical protein
MSYKDTAYGQTFLASLQRQQGHPLLALRVGKASIVIFPGT